MITSAQKFNILANEFNLQTLDTLYIEAKLKENAYLKMMTDMLYIDLIYNNSPILRNAFKHSIYDHIIPM